VLRFLRWQARWIERHLGGEEQMMLGAFCTDLALPLFVVGFFVDEPFLVYQMSAGALFFTGLAFIAAGQAILEAERAGDGNDVDSS
jgi:hypothetical protein